MKRTPTQFLAEATSAMVRDHDVTGTLATLVRDCGEALSAGAVCVLVRSEDGQIEPLSSSSHAIAELELFQVLLATGPCIDAISGVSEISVAGSADILARWPVVGRAIIEGGYQSVLSTPLRWRRGTVGVLSSFFVDSSPKTKEQVLLAQAFADVATMVILQDVELSVSQVSDRIRFALAGRIVIEQAKGVIGFQQALDMSAAYDLLVRTASRKRASLTATAERIVAKAQRRPRRV
jgi:GAF domain-containing protein